MFLYVAYIIPWESTNTTDLLASITGVITDLTPLLTIIIGIGIGLIVVSAIISAIRGHS
jgi:type II secretory pathway component PulF